MATRKLRLINTFRELLAKEEPLLDLTTTPEVLDQICDRLGDLLHGRGFDVLGAFEPVGFSLVPLLSVMERVPFLYYVDEVSSRALEPRQRLLMVCGLVSPADTPFLGRVAEELALSAVVSLVDSAESLDDLRSPKRRLHEKNKDIVPYLSLYTLEELHK